MQVLGHGEEVLSETSVPEVVSNHLDHREGVAVVVLCFVEEQHPVVTPGEFWFR